MKKWTHEEDSYILSNCVALKLAEVAKNIGRTPVAVGVRLERLRKQGVLIPSRQHRWTEAEDTFLRKSYPTKNKEHIQKVLNRTWSAINNRASKIGIDRHAKRPRKIPAVVGRRIEIGEDHLRSLYCEKELTLAQIATEIRCSQNTVMRRLKDIGIRRRPSGPSSKSGIRRIELSIDELIGYYVVQKLTFDQIGNIIGFSGVAVAKYAKRLGIVARGLSTGHGDIPGWYWGQVIGNAKKRNLDVTITIEEGWNLYLEQDRKCALTGVDIGFSGSQNRSTTTASLDRINSDLGYVEGNLQWIHKDIQPMKVAMSNDEFVMRCRTVTNYYDEGGGK